MIIEYADHLASKAIVLASASPRRREILGLLQLPFTVNVSNFEETLAKASFKTPAAYAVANATGKAREVASRETDADLVIGSDTIVVLDGAILEKPRSEGESYAMLKSLSGRSHTVISAIALFLKGSCVGAAWEAAEPAVARAVTTEVTFSELSDDAIYAYIRTGDPRDKAGSYGIQSIGGSMIEKVNGCYFNVMGLPMHTLALQIKGLIETKKL